MDKIITSLAAAFHAHDKELYLVGGSVRDELLGRQRHDVDLATNARPDEIRVIAAETHPEHIVPIGEKFGTIQLLYAGTAPIEITTYRGERYTPGSRHPDVQFGTSLLEDLRRRDFTINAIAKDVLTGEIVDPFDGQDDLKYGYIDAVEDPERRFRDDPLRMLRALRLSTQLRFGVTVRTLRAIERQAKELSTISQERIRDELSKMLLYEHPREPRLASNYLSYTLTNLLECGLFAVFLPEIVECVDVMQWPFHRYDVFTHTKIVVAMTSTRLTLRLAALLHDIAKPLTKSIDDHGTHFYGHEDRGSEMARAILRRLRFGNDVVEHVAQVVKMHMRINAYTPTWSNGAVRRLYLDAGETLEDLLDLALADGISDRDEPAEAVRARIGHLRSRLGQVQVEAIQQPLVCPLNGYDLIEAFGRKPGPWIKEVKRHLHDLVIDGALQADDKEGALELARAFIHGRPC